VHDELLKKNDIFTDRADLTNDFTEKINDNFENEVNKFLNN